jgi:hypothetical protein
MDLLDLADRPLVDQALGRHVRRIPGQRPIDRQANLLLPGRRDHAVGIPQGRGKRLLNQDVGAVGGDLFHRARMVGGRRAQDDQVRPACPQALPDIGEHPFRRNPEGGDGGAHPRGVLVADTGNLCIRVLVDLPQQVAHMHIVKVHADDAPRFRCHVSVSCRRTGIVRR